MMFLPGTHIPKLGSPLVIRDGSGNIVDYIGAYAPEPAILSIKVQRKVGDGEWVDGAKAVTITYGDDGATDLMSDVLDHNLAANEWPRRFASTSPGEYGLEIRDEAFGEFFLSTDARPENSTQNVLVEGYQNDETYPEGEPKGNYQWRLIWGSNSPEFFADFLLQQRAPLTFGEDDRYSPAIKLSEIFGGGGHST